MNGIFEGLAHVMMETFRAPTPAIYQPAGGQAVSVDAIVQESYRLVSTGADGIPVETSHRAVTVKTSDVPAPRYGDRVTLDGAAMIVRQVIPDGAGLVTLVLSQ